MAYEPIIDRVVQIQPDGTVIRYIKANIDSSDSKPMFGIAVSSELFERDTGKLYLFTEEGKWVVPDDNPGGGASIDLGITGASVGEYAKVKAVGPDGKPTEWESEPISTETIIAETDEWLEENISQETGYVLDRTLQLENAAAPADLVGELKNAVTQLDVINVYNALNYSVRNDNYGDQSSAINALINDCNTGDTVYLPNGQYRITHPIIINKSINFICDGEIRCIMADQSYSLIISENDAFVYYRTLTLYGENSGGVQIYNNSKTISRITVNFGRITATEESQLDCINLTADDYSIYVVHISGMRIYGNKNKNGISCIKTGQNATIGEILIKDTYIANSKNAIYAADNNLVFNAGNVNSIMCVNCHIEGNDNGFYYKNNRSPTVVNCRIAEQMAKSLFTFEGFVYNGTYVGRTPVKLLGINWIDPKPVSYYSGLDSYNNGFFINAPVRFSDIDSNPKTFAILDGGKAYTQTIELEETNLISE